MMFVCKFVRVLVISAAIVGTYPQKSEKQKVQSYASCRTDKDCKENAFCYDNDDDKDGKCKCVSGHILNRNSTFYECLSASKLGDPCERNLQCIDSAGPTAICNKYKICACDDQSHNVSEMCHVKIKLGDICMTNANCYIDNGTPTGGLAACVDGHCSCRSDEKPSQDRIKCLTSRELGEPCISDEECVLATPNTKCLEKCTCSTEYTLSRNESVCVKAATQFGEPCEYDGQCSKFLVESICTSQKCACNPGFHDYSRRCVQTRKIGEGCDEDAQCFYDKNLVNNVKCQGQGQGQGGVCTCLFGKKEDGSCKIEKGGGSSGHSITSTVLHVVLLIAGLRTL